MKLLLPGVVKSVYNLNDKQVVKLFSRIFNCNQEEMVRDLEQVGVPAVPCTRLQNALKLNVALVKDGESGNMLLSHDSFPFS